MRYGYLTLFVGLTHAMRSLRLTATMMITTAHNGRGRSRAA
jgi:hypothetical protein